MRVFIADDSPIVRARLISMLDDLDTVEIVGQARSGSDALEAIRKLRPHAVILDIRMPGLTGIEVLEEIKKFDPNLLVIMITNFPYQQYRDRCLSAGADYFFDKSSEFDKVVDVFAEAAART